MAGMRRAFAWATAGRYSVTAVNLVTAIVMARLIGPSAYGVSVLAGAALAIADAAREIGGGAYLIQNPDPSLLNIRASITLNLVITLIFALAIYSSADAIALFYGAPGIASYLHVSAGAYLLGPFIYPLFALMSREFDFQRIAFIAALMSLANAGATIGLAIAGFGFMSFAWGNVAGATVGSIFAIGLRASRSLYKPSLREWRGVLNFGIFDCGIAILSAAGASMPYLFLGRYLPAVDIAVAQRAAVFSTFPERVILAGVGSVALPGFSKRVRDKQSLRPVYFATIELMTAVQWPALVVLGLLAEPIVKFVLGAQWEGAARLVGILNVALVFSFPRALQYPALVALGGLRLLPLLMMMQIGVTLAGLAATAPHGLTAVAFSFQITTPINAFLSISALRRYVALPWPDLFWALHKSVAVAIAAAVAPLIAIVAYHGTANVSILAAAFSALGSATLSFAAMVLVHHPLERELCRAFFAMAHDVGLTIRRS